MKNHIIYILLIVFALFSCESLITEVPAKSVKLNEEKIAVSCFINPQDTLVAALVTKSNPLYSERKEIYNTFPFFGVDSTYETQSAIVETAKIILRDIEREEEVEMLYDPRYKAYVFRPRLVGANFRIREGSYALEVTVDGKTVTAETVVPERVNEFFRVNNNFNIESAGFGQPFSSIRVISSLGWTYRKSEKALFRLRGGVFFASETEVQENPIAPITTERTNNYSRLFFDNLGIFDGSDFTTSDSPQVTGNVFLYPSQIPENSISSPDVTVQSVHSELLTLSEDYYKFYTSFAQNRENNPFVEPTSVYSNIEGGLGIFAGSNSVKDVIFYNQE